MDALSDCLTIPEIENALGSVNNRAMALGHLLEKCKDLNVNAQGNQGETVLCDAGRHGYIATVKVLLRFGARWEIKNRADFTPIRLAREDGWTNVLEASRKARKRESKSDEKPEKEFIRKADTSEVIPKTSMTTAVHFDSMQVLRTRIKQATLEELNEASLDLNPTPLHCFCEVARLETSKYF
jgi:hypothetical protein